MKVICCGCGISIADKPSEGAGDADISHGLCQTCYQHFAAQMGMPLDEYIESIPTPVVTWGHDGIIGTANQKARELLGKELSDIQGYKGGDVFECENAASPEGCGRTVHCSGCVIRNTATDTAKTGRPHDRVPATITPVEGAGKEPVDLLISTEKKGEVVFLRIEPAGP